MSKVIIPRRISDLPDGNYETDKGGASLPASMGDDETFKYPLGAMEQAAAAHAEELIATEAEERELSDEVLRQQIGRKLPNTTLNPNSTGVTENASVSVRKGAVLDMTDGANVFLDGSAKLKIEQGAALGMAGTGTLTVRDAAKVKIEHGATLDMMQSARIEMGDEVKLESNGDNASLHFHSGARLYAAYGGSLSLSNNGTVNMYNSGSLTIGNSASVNLKEGVYLRGEQSGAVSGLNNGQSVLRITPSPSALMRGRRVYVMESDMDLTLPNPAVESFTPGDEFYFINGLKYEIGLSSFPNLKFKEFTGYATLSDGRLSSIITVANVNNCYQVLGLLLVEIDSSGIPVFSIIGRR